MENKWYEKMKTLNVDGIIFYPIFQNPYDIGCEIHRDYTTEEFKDIKGYPRSSWAYYKNKDGERLYYYPDDKSEFLNPIIKVQDETLTFNGQEIFTEVYCVMWDAYDLKMIFRSENEAKEFISKRIFNDKYSIKRMDVY